MNDTDRLIKFMREEATKAVDERESWFTATADALEQAQERYDANEINWMNIASGHLKRIEQLEAYEPYPDGQALAGQSMPPLKTALNLIRYFTTVHNRFGNTCIAGLSFRWGGSALNYKDEQQKRIEQLEAELQGAGGIEIYDPDGNINCEVDCEPITGVRYVTLRPDLKGNLCLMMFTDSTIAAHLASEIRPDVAAMAVGRSDGSKKNNSVTGGGGE